MLIGPRRTLLSRPRLIVPGGGVDTTPILLFAGYFDPTATTNPRVNTIADAPAGSSIVVCCATFNISAPSFTDGVNSYTRDPTYQDFNWYGAGWLNTFATAPIAAKLLAGSSIGPNTSGSTTLYMVVLAFPGAVSIDPEAGAMATTYPGNAGNASVTYGAVSGGSLPQYVALFDALSGGASTVETPAGFSDIAGNLGNNGGNFGFRAWVSKLTAANGSPTTITPNFPGSAGGVASAVAIRTVKVSN